MTFAEVNKLADEFSARAEAAKARGDESAAHVWSTAAVDVLKAEADSIAGSHKRSMARCKHGLRLAR